MTTRSVLVVLTAIAVTGCASATEPITCEGNPKCKADTQPSLPSKPQLDQAAPAAPRVSRPARPVA